MWDTLQKSFHRVRYTGVRQGKIPLGIKFVGDALDKESLEGDILWNRNPRCGIPLDRKPLGSVLDTYKRNLWETPRKLNSANGTERDSGYPD
jgi:hypothetical protein